MRLWHYKLLQHLPQQHLLGQHRECCALRGLGWGRPHSTVNYVFLYPPSRLYFYHCKVMTELNRLGIQYDHAWSDKLYRGMRAEPWPRYGWVMDYTNYPEHNAAYYQECLDNLQGKGFLIQKGEWFSFPPGDFIRKEVFM